MKATEIAEANEKLAAELRGDTEEERINRCFRTEKGWASVTKARVTESFTREMRDEKEVAVRHVGAVVYLDTIGAQRRRVKLPLEAVRKLEAEPYKKAAPLQAEADAKAARKAAEARRAAEPQIVDATPSKVPAPEVKVSEATSEKK